MLPATMQKRDRKEPLAEDPIDPYELVRRLSIIQAEETVRELERRRFDWEAELLGSRGVRQTQILNHTQTAWNGQPHRKHRRSASISLAPNQLPPLAYTDLPEPARKHSLPSFNRPQYMGNSRRPSLMRGDSGDLETISENAVIEPSMEDLFPEWSETQRRRPSALPRVNEDCPPRVESTLWKPRRRSSLTSQTEGLEQDSSRSDSQSMPRRRSPCSVLPPRSDEDCAPEFVSTEWKPRRRSSLTPQPLSREQACLPSDSQPISRRRSSSTARKEHPRQDWSQSDGSARTKSRKSSLLDKFEQYWKPGQVNTSDGDAFDSKASTLRNSCRSSMGDSTSSRRTSILKKIGDYWVVRPPSPDGQSSVKDIYTDDEGDSGVESSVAKRKPSLLSK